MKLPTKQNYLSVEQVLSGYDVVSRLYPHAPPLSVWRAWEFAGYQRYQLSEPILDIGCGDGQFLRLLWPQAQNIIGVEKEVGIADAARRSGVYQKVYNIAADKMSLPEGEFSTAFANCSLEHMDYLDKVLSQIWKALRPEGYLLCSVVTDKFLEWTILPNLVEKMGMPPQAQKLRSEYEIYHHLVNPLPLSLWVGHLEDVGFKVIEHIPILPEMTSRLFLFLDQLWHIQVPCGELGTFFHDYLAKIPHFPIEFGRILEGFLRMEKDWSIGSGEILWAQKIT